MRPFLESHVAAIPEKPYYKLNEVCQYTDTQPYVLRFWESEFPQLTPEKSRSGQPVYRRRDIDLVLRIKRLLQEEEQSISVAREILESNADGVPLAAVVDEPAPARRKKSAPRVAVTREPEPRFEPEPESVAEPTREPFEDRAEEQGDEEQETLAFDAVPRRRYDDAVEEVQHLKLELSDAEQRARRVETSAKKLEEANQRLREKNHRAAAILEELIDRLS